MSIHQLSWITYDYTSLKWRTGQTAAKRWGQK